MDKIKKEDLEKMYGKLIDTKQLTIQGFKDKLTFDIYDGLAYCADYKGDEYVLKYPKLSFIEDSVEMQKTIRDYLNLKDTDKISVLDVLQTYNEMDKNGERIEYSEEDDSYKPKDMWLVRDISNTD